MWTNDFFSIDKATRPDQCCEEAVSRGNDRPAAQYGGLNHAASAGEYVVVVRATDPSGELDGEENRDDITVTITANDVNEAPGVEGVLRA